MAISYNPLFEGVSGKIGPFVVVPDGDRNILRTRIYKYHRDEPQPDDPRWNVRDIAGQWRAVSGQGQADWSRLARVLWEGQGRPTPVPLRNYPLCLMTNLNRVAQNLPIDMTAPQTPDVPPFIGAVTLTAVVPVSPSYQDVRQSPTCRETLAAFQGTALRLTLGGADYAQAVFVYGAKTVYHDDPAPPEKKFCLLCVLPGLSAAGVYDVGAEYSQKCGGTSVGGRIFLRLVPVSAAGFRGPARVVDAVIGSL